jgi:energy-converting hydrogenase Eha subunit B
VVLGVAIPFVEYLLLGGIVGAIAFLLLWVSVRLCAAPGSSWQAIALHAARLGTLAIVLVGIARAGAIPLLSALAGILIARSIVLRWQRDVV